MTRTVRRGKNRKRKQATCEQKAAVIRIALLPKDHPEYQSRTDLSLKYSYVGCPQNIGKWIKQANGDPVEYYQGLASLRRRMSDINKKVYPKLQEMYEKKKRPENKFQLHVNHQGEQFLNL